MNTSVEQTSTALLHAWEELLEREPRTRIRNAAAQLGVSEAELLATKCGGSVRRITADIAQVLPNLEALGPLMALTRNDLFVHEKTGLYRNVDIGRHASQVVDENIDLRIFSAYWKHGFAVETEGRRGPRRSLQFFDAQGVAVHKVFLVAESDVEGYESRVREWMVEDQSPEQSVAPAPPRAEPRPDREIDVEELEGAWRAMRDTHDFFQILRSHDVQRTQAFRLVSDELARPAGNGGLRTVLETASAEDIDLMVFVRSPGTFQIHHGPVKRIVDTGEWLNVLDPGFDLHVKEKGIAATWVVRKPVETGWVTSVELYDDADELAALIFGCRSEGAPENAEWRELANRLE